MHERGLLGSSVPISKCEKRTKIVRASSTEGWIEVGWSHSTLTARTSFFMAVTYESTDSAAPCVRFHIELAFCHLSKSESLKRSSNASFSCAQVFVVSGNKLLYQSDASSRKSTARKFFFSTSYGVVSDWGNLGNIIRTDNQHQCMYIPDTMWAAPRLTSDYLTS